MSLGAIAHLFGKDAAAELAEGSEYEWNDDAGRCQKHNSLLQVQSVHSGPWRLRAYSRLRGLLPVMKFPDKPYFQTNNF